MKKKLYVAYGSNLNFRQMAYRCPDAALYGTGTLKGYDLQFKTLHRNAFATIGEKEDGTVPVAVWEITPKDEHALDIYEGYPSHYEKETVSVEIDGETVDGMVYIMNQEAQFGVPSDTYYFAVRQGYLDCGFDPDVLDNAVEESACLAEEQSEENWQGMGL
jgi:gamma-glutamylcyclotransferase (GGCT)/AIG2-like uncharacterized protein YtfP